MNETTPRENVMGPRIVAALIDFAILVVLGLIMAALFGDIGSSNGDDGSGFNVSLNGLPFVVYVVLSLGYYFVMESRGGQTLGKKVMKLKVAAVDGELTNQKVAIRTLLRIVDGLPFLYLLGVIVAAASSRNQRLGDMAAGTIIVRA